MIITDNTKFDAETTLLEHSGWSLQYRFTINNSCEETQPLGPYSQMWKAYHRYSGRILAFTFPTFSNDEPDIYGAATEVVNLVAEWIRDGEEKLK